MLDQRQRNRPHTSKCDQALNERNQASVSQIVWPIEDDQQRHALIGWWLVERDGTLLFCSEDTAFDGMACERPMCHTLHWLDERGGAAARHVEVAVASAKRRAYAARVQGVGQMLLLQEKGIFDVGVMRKGDTGTPEPLAKPRPRGRALGGPVGEIGKQARRMCPLPKKGSCGAIAERRALALGTSKEGMHMSSRVPSGLRRWSRSPQGALCHGWSASAAIIGYRKCTVGVSAACAAYVRGESLGLGRDWRSCLAL